MNSLGGVQSVVFLSIFSTSILSGGQLVAGNSNSSPASSSSSSSGGSSSSTRGIPNVASFDIPSSPVGVGLLAQREAPRWELEEGVARIVGGTPTPVQFQALLARFPQRVFELNFADLRLTDDIVKQLTTWFGNGSGLQIRHLSFANATGGHTTQFALLLETLAHHAPIENLNLFRTDVGNYAVRALLEGVNSGGFAQLRVLNLDHNNIDIGPANELAKALLIHIRRLDGLEPSAQPRWDIQGATARLVGTHAADLSAGGIYAAFMGHGRLAVERLPGAHPSPAEFETLLNALPAEIERLDLADSGLTAEHVPLLATWFRTGRGSNIQVLNLERNRIGLGGGETLVELVGALSLTQLVELNLRSTHLHNNFLLRTAAVDLFSALAANGFPSLRILHLEDNFMESASIQALARVLHGSRLPALQELHLEGNSIGDTEQGLLLVRAITHTRTLTRLNLSRTGIGADAMAILASAISDGGFEELRYLNLSLNRYGNEDAILLAHALRNRPIPALEELDIHNESALQVSSRRSGIQQNLRHGFEGARDSTGGAVPTAQLLAARARFESTYESLAAALGANQMGLVFVNSFQVGSDLQLTNTQHPAFTALIESFRQALSGMRQFSNDHRGLGAFDSILISVAESCQQAEELALAYAALFAKNRNLRLTLPESCSAFSAKFQ